MYLPCMKPCSVLLSLLMLAACSTRCGEGWGQGKHCTVAGNHSVFSAVGAQLCLPLGWFCSRLSPVTSLHCCGLGGGFLVGDRDSLEHPLAGNRLGRAATATI